MIRHCRAGLLRARDETGAEVIEYIAMVPLVIAAAMIGIQLLIAVQTVLIASSAAREGARAAAVCEDVNGAVSRAAPGYVGPSTSVARNGDQVIVVVGLQIPNIAIPLISQGAMPLVNGRAVMRAESCR